MVKKQVSIKVYMDEDLYHFYSSIADGSKGQLIRDALQMYRDLSSISSKNYFIKLNGVEKHIRFHTAAPFPQSAGAIFELK